MTTQPPLQLLFDQPMAVVKANMQLLVAADYGLAMDFNRDPSGDRKTLQHGSLGYEIGWSEILPDFCGYRTVFFEPQFTNMQTILSLSLGPHLEGGARVAPIAKALLALGAELAITLNADAVVWNPGKLVSEPAFFVESVQSYANGGAFPVLVAVDFEYSNDEHCLHTTGLSWFSGQEITVSGGGLRGQDLTRRGVRLIHDIALNGPIVVRQQVPDLDSKFRIDLVPSNDADNVLRCLICARTDATDGALSLH